MIQTELDWNVHKNGAKHIKSVATLIAAEAVGEPPQFPQYENPLVGCTKPGVLGEVIDGSKIDGRLASNHGFGLGSKISKDTPLVGKVLAVKPWLKFN